MQMWELGAPIPKLFKIIFYIIIMLHPVIATGCYVYYYPSNLYLLFLRFLIKGFPILMFSLIQSMESSLPFISSTLFQLYSYIWLFYDFCPILLMVSL